MAESIWAQPSCIAAICCGKYSRVRSICACRACRCFSLVAWVSSVCSCRMRVLVCCSRAMRC
ncbi:hypothetical protein D9M69_706840 [compost metagenome]